MLKDVLTEDTIVIFDTEFTSWEGSAERNWSLESENREGGCWMGSVALESRPCHPNKKPRCYPFKGSSGAGTEKRPYESDCADHSLTSLAMSIAEK